MKPSYEESFPGCKTLRSSLEYGTPGLFRRPQDFFAEQRNRLLKKSFFGGTFSKTFDLTSEFTGAHRERSLCTRKTKTCGISGVGRLLCSFIFVFKEKRCLAYIFHFRLKKESP